MGDADYIHAFQKVVMPIAMEFAPELVISGYIIRVNCFAPDLMQMVQSPLVLTQHLAKNSENVMSPRQAMRT